MQSALPDGVTTREPYTTEVAQTSFVVVPVTREDAHNSTGSDDAGRAEQSRADESVACRTDQAIGFLASSSTRYCPV